MFPFGIVNIMNLKAIVKETCVNLEKGIKKKEQIATIRNMKIVIYSDHNPPHFHVKSKDNKINAKFKIENCESSLCC